MAYLLCSSENREAVEALAAKCRAEGFGVEVSPVYRVLVEGGDLARAEELKRQMPPRKARGVIPAGGQTVSGDRERATGSPRSTTGSPHPPPARRRPSSRLFASNSARNEVMRLRASHEKLATFIECLDRDVPAEVREAMDAALHPTWTRQPSTPPTPTSFVEPARQTRTL